MLTQQPFLGILKIPLYSEYSLLIHQQHPFLCVDLPKSLCELGVLFGWFILHKLKEHKAENKARDRERAVYVIHIWPFGFSLGN